WEFVDASLAQYPAEGRNTRIVLDFKQRTSHFIQRNQLVLTLLGVRSHGAKFVHAELSLVETDPSLTEESRSRRSPTNQYRDDQKYGSKQDEEHSRKNDIEAAFHQRRPTVALAGKDHGFMIAVKVLGRGA